MTREEKISACKNQFVYEHFLESYQPLLIKLYKNRSFISTMREVFESTSEWLLYGHCSTASENSFFKRFKDEICNDFFTSLKFEDYPEYKEIYYAVKDCGYSGKSATLSIFYAMLYFDVSSEDESITSPISSQKKKSFFKKTFKLADLSPTVQASTPSTQTAPQNKCRASSVFLKKDFESYLIRQGYKQYTPSGHPSTVYAYIKSIDEVCATEGLTWNTLTDSMCTIVSEYGSGGSKEHLGNKSHKTVINALLRYSDFLRTI